MILGICAGLGDPEMTKGYAHSGRCMYWIVRAK